MPDMDCKEKSRPSSSAWIFNAFCPSDMSCFPEVGSCLPTAFAAGSKAPAGPERHGPDHGPRRQQAGQQPQPGFPERGTFPKRHQLHLMAGLAALLCAHQPQGVIHGVDALGGRGRAAAMDFHPAKVLISAGELIPREYRRGRSVGPDSRCLPVKDWSPAKHCRHAKPAQAPVF